MESNLSKPVPAMSNETNLKRTPVFPRRRRFNLNKPGQAGGGGSSGLVCLSMWVGGRWCVHNGLSLRIKRRKLSNIHLLLALDPRKLAPVRKVQSRNTPAGAETKSQSKWACKSIHCKSIHIYVYG